ncbi:alpha-amylase family protein [Corynebacterium sp. 335C]
MTDRRTGPAWTDHTIGWHVYPLGFTGAPVHDRGGDGARVDGDFPARLDHLTAWLDYVQELGLNVLQLGPVFQSSTHGYDTTDFFRIDDRLGDDDAFDRLIAAAHDRGIRVLLDGVFNHVGREHPAVAEALADESSDAARLFAVDRSGDEPTLPVFEGHDALVELDHGSDAVKDLVRDVMLHWLRRGADGWRLDAAYAVDPKFWADVLPAVREEFPEAFIYGEVIHGDYADIVATSGMDSVTEYELWKATWSSLKEGNFYELEWTLGRHNGFLDAFRPVTFVGNHDVTRIASQVGAEKSILALAVLMTVGGVPLVYYGDEQGYTGVKKEDFGGDDQIRPVFPAAPEDLSEVGQWIGRAHQGLIGVRRRNPWLRDANPEVADIGNLRLVYNVEGRDDEGQDRQLNVELDMTDADAPFAVIRDHGEEIWRFPEA